MQLMINGKDVSVDVDPDTPLLWVIRDELGLTGTKYGCGVASCGACTVHMNGQPIRSCVTPISAADGASVTTIEGLSDEGLADNVGQAVQQAWVEKDVVQCGYCQSGQIMSAVGLLKSNPNPSDEDINRFMNGNACRCATYVRIKDAIKLAATQLGQNVGGEA